MHVVRVAGKMWVMESTAAARHPDITEIVDTICSMDYKTREAVGQLGVIYRVFIDNSVCIAD